MNYIKLLNAAFEKFYFDDRLNPTHISLYMALFQEWNSSRFADEFYVNRRDLMRCAKIGSKSTYHRWIWIRGFIYAISHLTIHTKEVKSRCPLLVQVTNQIWDGTIPH